MYFVIKEYGNRYILISKHYLKYRAGRYSAMMNRIYNGRHSVINETYYRELWYSGKLSDPDKVMGEWYTGD